MVYWMPNSKRGKERVLVEYVTLLTVLAGLGIVWTKDPWGVILLLLMWVGFSIVTWWAWWMWRYT